MERNVAEFGYFEDFMQHAFPLGIEIKNVPVETLSCLMKHVTLRQAYLMPYYGFEVESRIIADDNGRWLRAFVNGDMVPEISPDLIEKLKNPQMQYQAAAGFLTMQAAIHKKIRTHLFDDMLVYGETKSGYMEFWMHKSGSGSLLHVAHADQSFESFTNERVADWQSRMPFAATEYPDELFQVAITPNVKVEW